MREETLARVNRLAACHQFLRGYMSYNYQQQRHKIFTEDGTRMLMRMRDKARELLNLSGAVIASKIMMASSGDGWQMLACIDYMVEQGDLRRVTGEFDTAGQDQVFVDGNNSLRG